MDNDSKELLPEPEPGREGVNTPVETPNDNPADEVPETTKSVDSSEVLAALDAIDDGEEDSEESSEAKKVAVKTANDAEIQLKAEAKKASASIKAAVTTGGIATGIEQFLAPVVVTEEMRKDFHEALVPVLLKGDGAVLPEWVDKLLADWKEELDLARKTVCIGWALWEQRGDIKAGRIKPPQKKKRYRLPSSETTKRAEAA